MTNPSNPSTLPLSVPKFDDRHYLDSNPKVMEAIRAGTADNALDHFIRFGIDENRYPLIRREAGPLQAAVERYIVSESGFCLILGWLADEGVDPPRLRLYGGEFNIELPPAVVLRHARRDVEDHIKGGAYDYGYVIFGQSPSKSLLKQPVLFQVNTLAGTFQSKITPEVVSDKRLMDTLLQVVASYEFHAGKEVSLNAFLTGPAGDSLYRLFQMNVASAISAPYVERFRPRPVSCSFVTVLFGSTEPINLQPLLFNAAKVDFGEWIYVCNSPEDAATVLRYARLISDLYDVMITVIVLGDNAGFGAANNVAIENAASHRIFIMNPDVHVMPTYAAGLQQMLSDEDLGTTLWGGLLFYDDHNLMHSGMYLEKDSFVRRNSLNRNDTTSSHCGLLRVEHFDKGVPYVESDWSRSRPVPAITGAVMVFNREGFDKLGGFSTRYIYGHYEDADLSMRWRDSVGDVAIHPKLRLVHLEGQGSRARGEEFRGAALSNRYFFTAQHGATFDAHRDELGKTNALATAER